MNNIYNFQGVNINVLGNAEKPFFFASQISKALGYIDTTDSIRKHVWLMNKITFEDYQKNNLALETIPGDLACKPGENSKNMNPKTLLLSHAGVFQLIFSSKLPNTFKFHDWFKNDVLQKINDANSKPDLELKHNQFVILNEADLQMKVVHYLRNFYKNVLFNAILGENQSTPQKRIDSYYMGYAKGMVDLIVYENSKHFNGLCIEMKSPAGKGILSEHQKSIILKLEERGYKCVVSDNYDDIIIQLNDYLKNIRHKCYYCKNRYRSLDKLSNHLRVIHKK